IPELAGERQTVIAGHVRSFDEQYVAADARHSQPGGNPRRIGPLGYLRLEAGAAKVFSHVVGPDGGRHTASPRVSSGCNLAQKLTDVALQTAHPGFTCMAFDDRQQGVVAE